jgi:hypothetical protein
MFERRGPELNKGKIGQLLIDLGSDENNGVRWRAFLRKSGLTAPGDFGAISARSLQRSSPVPIEGSRALYSVSTPLTDWDVGGLENR